MVADWDIRLQCTVCGTRVRRCRADGDPPFGREPQSTATTVCSQCTANAGYPVDGVETLHFVDYASPEELAEFDD